MKKLEDQKDYYVYVACSPPLKPNVWFRHASIGVDVEVDGQKRVLMTDFGSAAIDNYGKMLEQRAVQEAGKHFKKLQSSIETAVITSCLLLNSGQTIAAGISLVGILFSGLMYAGHKHHPGALLTQGISERADSKLRRYFRIKVNEAQYKKAFNTIKEDLGERPFAVWSKNCASYSINCLKDIGILGDDLPVKKRLGARVLRITTPRYLERIIGHLQVNDRGLEIDELILNDDGQLRLAFD